MPVFPHYSTCTGTPIEMTMNHGLQLMMQEMYMFSNGQKSRMFAILASGGIDFHFANLNILNHLTIFKKLTYW